MFSSPKLFGSDKTLNATIHNTNHRLSTTIWLDAAVNMNEAYRKIQQQLRTIVNCLKTFENRNECEKYIRSTSSQEQLLSWDVGVPPGDEAPLLTVADRTPWAWY